MAQPPVTSRVEDGDSERASAHSPSTVLEACDVTKSYVLDEVVVNALQGVDLEVR